MTAFPGWTWEYIDNNMTLPRYSALVEYWRKCPPPHMTTAYIARWLGYKDQEGGSSQAPGDSTFGNGAFWDESYYPDTPQTPHKGEAYRVLSREFEAAGGKLN